MTEYETQANDFAAKYGVELIVHGKQNKKYFPEDKEPRDVYDLEIKRSGRGSYKFNFGQSIANSEHWKDKITQRTSTDAEYAKRVWGIHVVNIKGSAPTMYDVLTCFTKYDPGDFEDFCSEYGYDTDSRKALDTYNAVTKEYINIARMFADVMEELEEIQ